MSDANEAALRKATDAFNDTGNREGYLELYAPDVVLHGYPRGLEGREGARSFYSQLWTAFPDARLSVEEVISAGERLAVRYSLSGVQASDFYGAATTGGSTTIEGIAWLRFEGGQAVEVWQTSGTLDTLTRLNARASRAPTRPSASAEAAALRWEERHPDD